MLKIFTFLFIFFFVVTFTAEPVSSDISNVDRCSSLLANGYGPMKIELAEKELNSIRLRSDSYYSSAKEFVSSYGGHFIELVLSRLPEGRKVTVVIAMGGAEHLGTLLEMYFETSGLSKQVEVKYVPLSREIVRPWYATPIANTSSKLNPKLPAIDPPIRSGIGPVPPGYTTGGSKNESDPKQLADHIRPFDLFSNSKLIVVDTGYRGTTVEALAYLAKESSYSGEVEGVLLSHRRNTLNTVPVEGLATFIGADKETEYELETVSARMDFNNVEGADWWEGASAGAFQRSHFLDESSRLVSIKDFPIRMENYKSTLLGLRDGLAGHYP